MNKFILDRMLVRFKNQKTQFMISSLSYYAILALIPTLLLTTTILKFFNINPYLKYQDFLDSISINNFSNLIVFIITLYMISRIFFVSIKAKFSTLKSIVLSIIFSIIIITFLGLFLSTYTLKTLIISIIMRFLLLTIFIFLIIQILSKSELKYSIIFSLITSIFSIIFISIFSLIASFFINYENYYGMLAPIFIIILIIHIFINIVIFAFICAEEFTKISKIKFIKS